MKFNKCKVLHLDWGYLRLGGPIVTSPMEKHLGVLVDEDMDMSQQCALMAQKSKLFLGYMESRVASRSRDSAPPLCSHKTPPEVLHPTLGY